MLLGGKSAGKNDDVKAVLESLTTTIEAINQRLAGGTGGGAGDEGTAKKLQQLSSWLQYSYDLLKTLHQGQGEIKSGLTDFKNEIGKIVADNLQSSMTEMRRVVQVMETGGGSTGQTTVVKESFTPTYVIDINKRLEQLVLLHTEEAELFRKQNLFLQQRLAELERKLDLAMKR